jgi:hypothetical protein
MADTAPEASAPVAVPLSAKASSERRDDSPTHPGTPPVAADGKRDDAPAARKEDAEERKRREEEEARKKRDADGGDKKSGGFHLHPRIHEALKATEHAVEVRSRERGLSARAARVAEGGGPGQVPTAQLPVVTARLRAANGEAAAAGPIGALRHRASQQPLLPACEPRSICEPRPQCTRSRPDFDRRRARAR